MLDSHFKTELDSIQLQIQEAQQELARLQIQQKQLGTQKKAIMNSASLLKVIPNKEAVLKALEETQIELTKTLGEIAKSLKKEIEDGPDTP